MTRLYQIPNSLRVALLLGSLFTATTARASGDDSAEGSAEPPARAPTQAEPSGLPEARGPAAEVPEAARRMESHWYGWQTLTTDGLSIGLLVGGLALSGDAGARGVSNGFLVAGAVGYSLGGPIVHFLQRNPGRGVASFMLRVPAPIAVGGLTALTVCGGGGGDFAASWPFLRLSQSC